MIIELLLLTSALIYAILLFTAWVGLHYPDQSQQDQTPRVSVIVAARDEEEPIGALLTDLIKQTYPVSNLEIIIVNDHSSDRTADRVLEYCREYDHIHLLHAEHSTTKLSAKKRAMQEGILQSRGEIILTTDADCRLRPEWIKTMVSYFTPGIGMVVGFSQLGSGSPGLKVPLFQKLQAIDFLSLMSAAQGFLNLGWPLASSGQNLAYRRTAFEDVGGFNSIGHRISGDDVLLLQLINKRTKWKIRFASSPLSYNTSAPEENISGFFNQRKRWASNGAYQLILNKAFFLFVLITYLLDVMLLASILLLCFNNVNTRIVLACFLLKALAEGALVFKGASVYRRLDLISVFPLWFLLQIPYVVVVGTLGSIGTFKWKKRKHTSSGIKH